MDPATLASFLAEQTERDEKRERDDAAVAATVIRLVLGLIAAIVFVVAGLQFFSAGAAMDIESVGGRTLEEAFYQAYGVLARGLGIVAFAMAALSVALAIHVPRR